MSPHRNEPARHSLSGIGRNSPGDAKMPDKVQDIIVIGGLVCFFLWTYVVLPLAFYHS